jgi:hypothetical protein
LRVGKANLGDVHGAQKQDSAFQLPKLQRALQHHQKSIIKVEAGPETVNRETTCRPCGGPLQAPEGIFVCKYFPLRKALSHDGRSRRGSQRYVST